MSIYYNNDLLVEQANKITALESEAQRLRERVKVLEECLSQTGPMEAMRLREECERLKPNQREHDLVRQMRMELFHDDLISREEYTALASEHGSVQRLEDYDRWRRIEDAARALVEFRNDGSSNPHVLERLWTALENALAGKES